MKKIYTIILLLVTVFTVSSVSSAADSSKIAGLTLKADTAIYNIASDAAMVKAVLNVAQVDFGKCTGLKDSVAAAFETLPSDTNAQKVKKKVIELLVKEQAHKATGQKFWDNDAILAILAIILAVVAYALGHFRVFFKKSDSYASAK